LEERFARTKEINSGELLRITLEASLAFDFTDFINIYLKGHGKVRKIVFDVNDIRIFDNDI